MSEQDYTVTADGATARAYAYLLGEMGDAERLGFEHDLLADAEFYETYLVAQDELIESYIYDELTPERRARFVSHFLTSEERRARLQLIRDMSDRVESLSTITTSEVNLLPVKGVTVPAEPKVSGSLISWLRGRFGAPRLRFAFVLPVSAAVLLLACFFVWRLTPEKNGAMNEQAHSEHPTVIGQDRSDASHDGTTTNTVEKRSPPDAAQVAATNQSSPARREEARNSAPPRRRVTPTASYALTLSPISLRDAGSETPRLRIPAAANGTLRLRLILDGPVSGAPVRARVQTAEGVEVSVLNNLSVRPRQSSASFVIMKLALGSLADGDYTISLTDSARDGETILVGRYSFSVVRR